MDHAAGMRVGDRLRDRLEDRQEPRQAVRGILAAGKKLGQRVPLDQLHAEEGPTVGEGAHFVDRHDPRVLQLAADLHLLDEPADHVAVIAEVLAQHLQGHVAADVRVVPFEHRAHAAPGDLAVDPIAQARARRPDSAQQAAARGRRRCRAARHGAAVRCPTNERLQHGSRGRRCPLAAAAPLELDGHQFGLQCGAEPTLAAEVILEPGMLAGSPRRLEAVA